MFCSSGTLCNCSEIPPSPSALGCGEWRGQSWLHDPSREMAGGPHARRAPLNFPPPQDCAAAPRDGEAPQEPTPLPADIIPCPSVHTVTVRPGAGCGPVLARAPRAAGFGCRSDGEKSSWEKRFPRTIMGLSAPCWGAKRLLHLLLCSHRHRPSWTQPAWDTCEDQSLQCVCVQGVAIPWVPPAPSAAASMHQGG